jgi:WD40 repeat protein
LGALELRDGRLLSWSVDTTLRLWAADGTELTVLRGHEGSVSGALELRDGRLLSWSDDKTLRLWAADGAELKVLEGHESPVIDVLELDDRQLISRDGYKLHLWSEDLNKKVILGEHDGRVQGAQKIRGRRLLSWSSDSTLRLWTLDGIAQEALKDHGGEITGALELRNGHLISWSRDRTLRLWAIDGTEKAVFHGHESEVLGALELRDGKILSWSRDKTLRLWTVNGTMLGSIRRDALPAELRAWFINHDADWQTFIKNYECCTLLEGKGLLVWHYSRDLYLCHAESGEQLMSFYADSEIKSVRFLQSGAVIALGCSNGQVIFLKVAI